MNQVFVVPEPTTLNLTEVGVRVLGNDATVSDFLMLSNLYSKLWLTERKPEGLETIVGRFWGAGGKEDLRRLET